jgi:hypothetical protein
MSGALWNEHGRGMHRRCQAIAADLPGGEAIDGMAAQVKEEQ